jgi:hypothetical protein
MRLPPKFAIPAPTAASCSGPPTSFESYSTGDRAQPRLFHAQEASIGPIATCTLAHRLEYPSRILLPILPFRARRQSHWLFAAHDACGVVRRCPAAASPSLDGLHLDSAALEINGPVCTPGYAANPPILSTRTPVDYMCMHLQRPHAVRIPLPLSARCQMPPTPYRTVLCCMRSCLLLCR